MSELWSSDYDSPEPHPNRWWNWWLNQGNQGAVKTSQQVSDEFWHPSRPTVCGRIKAWLNSPAVADYQPEGLPGIIPPAGGLANMPEPDHNFVPARNSTQPEPTPEEEIRFVPPSAPAFISPSDANVIRVDETGTPIEYIRRNEQLRELMRLQRNQPLTEEREPDPVEHHEIHSGSSHSAEFVLTAGSRLLIQNQHNVTVHSKWYRHDAHIIINEYSNQPQSEGGEPVQELGDVSMVRHPTDPDARIVNHICSNCGHAEHKEDT